MSCLFFYEDTQTDHSDEDGVVVIMLSHGDSRDPLYNRPDFTSHTILNHDQWSFIQAQDTFYPLQKIFQYLTNDNCPTLRGKPRLFFIQACQGTQLDSGFGVEDFDRNGNRDSSDSMGHVRCERKCSQMETVLPHEDFLVAYSTFPTYASFRNPTQGTWFIQELCEELDANDGGRDLLNMLTHISRRIALNRESFHDDDRLDKKKQVPCVSSMLTKLLIFPKKDDHIVDIQ